MEDPERGGLERVQAVLYPLSDTRAIALGPASELDALGRSEGAVGESWLRLLRQSLGASGAIGDLAQTADGRIVRLTAESAKLLQQNEAIQHGAHSIYGVVRNAETGRIAGVLSFQTGALVGAAAAAPALLGAIAMQRQLAVIERKLDELQASVDYLIEQINLTIQGDLIASIEILDRVYARVQRTGEFSDDDYLQVANVQLPIRSLHVQTSRRLEQLAQQLVPGGSMGTRVTRLKSVLQTEKASFWLQAHVQAELALTKWQWLEVMRQAHRDVGDLETLLTETEGEILERRRTLELLATRLGAFVSVGDEDLIDRIRFVLRRRLRTLVAELDTTLEAFRSDLAPLGVDARAPIALGTGDEEDSAWARIVEQLQAGKRFVDPVVDRGERAVVKTKQWVTDRRKE